MGNQSSQTGSLDLETFWDRVPSGGEIVITRNKITISDSPRLDIGERVLSNDLEPTRHRRLKMSLSDLNYEGDTDSVISHAIRNEREEEDKKRSESSLALSANKIETDGRSEFNPEFAAPDMLCNSPIQFMEDPIAGYTLSDAQSDISKGYSINLGQRTETLCLVPTPNFEGHEYLSEVNHTPGFDARTIAEENMRDLQNFLKQHLDSSEYHMEPSTETKSSRNISARSSTVDLMTNEDKGVSVREINDSVVIRNEDGAILAKKLATQAEQKGMRECHVYFTPRTSAEIWPPLVVTVGEDWDFVKVMRKSIANYQRSMSKGERDGTHEWIFKYHPNKDIKRIRKELKVLFGPKVITFRDSNLRKKVKDVTTEFINKMWILQKDDDKQGKARVRTKTYSKSCKTLRVAKSNVLRNRSQSLRRAQNRKAITKNYSRLSLKV